MATIRPAGYNERRCISRDVLGLYGTIVVCATYTSRTEYIGAVLQRNIAKALKQCITEHPALTTLIKDAETEKPMLVKAPTLHLEQHLQFVSRDQVKSNGTGGIHALVQLAHNQPLEDWHIRPRWRLYILPASTSATRGSSFYAAFAFSHALADGSSGVKFHQTFLHALQHVGESAFDGGLTFEVPDSVVPPPPALEHAAKLRLSWSFLVPVILAEMLPSWLSRALGYSSSRSVDRWTGAMERPALPGDSRLLQTAICIKQVSNTATNRALAAYRAHNARLTGVIAVVAARSLGQALRARGKSYEKFSVPLPLDLRRCIPAARDCMANYLSVMTAEIAISCSPPDEASDKTMTAVELHDWSTAQDLTQRLVKASNTLTDQPIALLSYISNMRQWTLQQATRPPTESFEASNVGVFDDTPATTESSPVASDWHAEDIVFSQSANALGAPLNMSVASAKGGPLSLALTW